MIHRFEERRVIDHEASFVAVSEKSSCRPYSAQENASSRAASMRPFPGSGERPQFEAL
jgi:hypothetical protein